MPLKCFIQVTTQFSTGSMWDAMNIMSTYCTVMRRSLDFFLLGCFHSINSQKWSYEIRYMTSLVAPVMINKFLQGNKKRRHFSLLPGQPRAHPGPMPHIPQGQARALCWALGSHTVCVQQGFSKAGLQAEARVPAGEADSCWPPLKADLSPREKPERKCCFSFYLESTCLEQQRGGGHRTELEKDLTVWIITVYWSVLLPGLFIMKTLCVQLEVGITNFYLLLLCILLFQRKAVSLSHFLLSTSLSPLVCELS